MPKDILITPGSAKIDFCGENAGTIRLETLDDGTIAFIGSEYTLFQIADDLAGVLWTVNDSSALPVLQVNDNGILKVDEIDELTSDHGVTIENVLIKDGTVDGVDLAAHVHTGSDGSAAIAGGQ